MGSATLKAESTTIHCWTQSSGLSEGDMASGDEDDILCGIGTLEPAVVIYRLRSHELSDVHRESLSRYSHFEESWTRALY
jgi:hypothetical protein